MNEHECVNEEEKENSEKTGTAEKWQFGNNYEYILYLGYAQAGGNMTSVAFEDPDEYYRHYENGFKLYDEHKYGDALEEYRKALKLNPVAINTRFEICECLLAIGQIRAAEQILLDSAYVFIAKADAARFYRRMSYIASEKHQWKLAMACIQYSITYEYSDAAKKEIEYITAVKGKDFDVDNPEAIVRKAGIPIISAKDVDDRNDIEALKKVFNLVIKKG